MFKKRMPRILQIHLRRYLHDRKLPEITNKNKLPLEIKKIGTKSPKNEGKTHINKESDKNIKNNK